MNIQYDMQRKMLERAKRNREEGERGISATERRYREMVKREKRTEAAVAAGCVCVVGSLLALLIWAVVAMCRADAELAESEAALAAEEAALAAVQAEGGKK